MIERLWRWLRRVPPEPLDRTGPATLYVMRDGNPGRHLQYWQDLVDGHPGPPGHDSMNEPTAEYRTLRVPRWVHPDQ